MARPTTYVKMVWIGNINAPFTRRGPQMTQLVNGWLYMIANQIGVKIKLINKVFAKVHKNAFFHVTSFL